MYLSKSPLWLRWFYPQLTWHRSRKEKHVYLTFDDGPIPVVTPLVLNTLKNFDALATFFCIGDNVSKYPEIYADILANGHRTGNHTFNHLKGWNTPDNDYLANIEKCSELVKSNLFRPPYGRIRKSQIKKFSQKHPSSEIIMWDVLSGDFDTSINSDDCTLNVLKHVRNGSIIVFHDSLKAFPRLESSLPDILQELKTRGYSFKLL